MDMILRYTSQVKKKIRTRMCKVVIVCMTCIKNVRLPHSVSKATPLGPEIFKYFSVFSTHLAYLGSDKQHPILF